MCKVENYRSRAGRKNRSGAIADAESYHAILATTADRARKAHKEIDEAVASGKKLASLRAGYSEDNFLAFGARTTAASHILENF